jgi:hypothetical protein
VSKAFLSLFSMENGNIVVVFGFLSPLSRGGGGNIYDVGDFVVVIVSEN